jgi:DNA polymerase elongation subunit (family B)
MQNCLKCGFKHWIKTDEPRVNGLRVRKCGRCGTECLEDKHFERQEPKVVYVDIETSLMDVSTFQLMIDGGYISHKMIKNPGYIICWSANWVGEKEIISECVSQHEAMAKDDRRILLPLWDLLNRADVIAGHNSNRFDIPIVTGRFVIHNFEPLDKFRTYDTKVMAKRHKFESNTMDYLCKLFGISQKEKMDIDDWIRIRDTGDEKTLAKMLKYNRHDVAIGVQVLERLQKYHNWPNHYPMLSFPGEPKDKRFVV